MNIGAAVRPLTAIQTRLRFVELDVEVIGVGVVGSAAAVAGELEGAAAEAESFEGRVVVARLELTDNAVGVFCLRPNGRV